MTRVDRFVSVVAPLRNDAEIIPPFVTEVVDVLREHFTNYELLLVDDGSRDRTPEVVAQVLQVNECVRLIRLSRTFGEEIAIAAGLDSVIGDFAVVILPNYDPPALIPELVRRARESGAGVVYGIPRSRPDETVFARFGGALWGWVARRLLTPEAAEPASHFRVLTRQAVTAIVRNRRRSRHLHVLSTDVGFTSVGFAYDPIVRNPRRPRRSLWNRARRGVAVLVANSLMPLRLATMAGVAGAVVNLGYSVWWATRDSASRGGAMSIPLALMFVLLFFVLAVVGQYIVHVFVESHDRPLYHVLGERSSAVDLADRNRRNIAVSSVDDHA